MSQYLRGSGVIVVLATALAICGAKDDSPLAVIKELNANYAAITLAFQHKDIDMLSQFLAPEFSALDKSGISMSRRNVLEDFRHQMATISKVTWVRQVNKIKVKPGEAKVVVDGRFSGTMIGDDRKSHIVQMHAVAEDTWVKSGGKWLLKGSFVLRRSMMLDGKPMKGKRG